MDSSSSSPPFLSWLNSSSTSDPNKPSPNPKPNPKPKPKRSGKSPATKRAPQRGLGVAQLERIRLQEKIKKLPFDHQIQTFPINLPSIYEHQQQQIAMDQSICRIGAPICYMPQYRVGFGHVSAIRSVLHEQYAMDRVRTGAGSPVSSELPSNQIKMTVCVSDECDFCVRRKRMMSENQWIFCGNGVDHHPFLMSTEEKRVSGATREEEIKEYEFFPQNSSESKCVASVIGASSFSSDYGHTSSKLVDLSLKLSND